MSTYYNNYASGSLPSSFKRVVVTRFTRTINSAHWVTYTQRCINRAKLLLPVAAYLDSVATSESESDALAYDMRRDWSKEPAR